MTERFSLNDLFKIGVNRDNFRSKFTELKNNPEFASQFSVFNDEDIEGALDNIFGIADENGDGQIDENEILSIKNKFQDENQEEISENDIKMLYQEALAKKYATGTPKQMYEAAMGGVSDVRESGYIEDLDTSISTYEGFIASRQTTSDLRIGQLQSQIDDIVKRTAASKGEDTTKYDQLSGQLSNLQAQASANNIRLQREQRELEAAQKEAKRLEKEIKDLNSDPEGNKVEIESRQSELNQLQGTIYNLSTSITTLKAANKGINEKLKKTNKDMESIQRAILANDKDAQREVKALKDKIAQEKKDAESDIDGYKDEIKTLTKAREFAYKKITSAQSAGEVAYDYTNTGENVPALKDVKYSAEKGQKLANDIRSHAVGFVGYCSRHVSNALERTGLGHERMASAHMMDTELDKNPNFQRITVSSVEELRSLPAGCIVVYEAGAAGYNKTHGHIEVTLGNGTACSDGITRNMRFSERMSVFVPVG